MRTVKTKKELIKAIEDGEKHIYVADEKLYMACKIAKRKMELQRKMESHFLETVMQPINLVSDKVIIRKSHDITIPDINFSHAAYFLPCHPMSQD